MTQTAEYDSNEERDGVLQSPMDQGAGHSYNQLDAMVADQLQQR